jgi:hypothetical protein
MSSENTNSNTTPNSSKQNGVNFTIIAAIISALFALSKWMEEVYSKKTQIDITIMNQKHDTRQKYLAIALQPDKSDAQGERVLRFLKEIQDDTVLSKWAAGELDSVRGRITRTDSLKRSIDSLTKVNFNLAIKKNEIESKYNKTGKIYKDSMKVYQDSINKIGTNLVDVRTDLDGLRTWSNELQNFHEKNYIATVKMLGALCDDKTIMKDGVNDPGRQCLDGIAYNINFQPQKVTWVEGEGALQMNYRYKCECQFKK